MNDIYFIKYHFIIFHSYKQRIYKNYKTGILKSGYKANYTLKASHLTSYITISLNILANSSISIYSGL